MLLINGIGGRLELLEPFVAALDPAVEVIRFDPPGVGGSPLPPRAYRFTGLCRLIAGMLTELGYDRVDVLGISWGGGVAQHFAAFQRARCRRLVLVATATGTPMVPARPSVLRHMVSPRRQLDRAYLHRIAGDIYGGLARIDSAPIVTAMHGGHRPARRAATCTSSPPRRAGPACRSCRGCASRRSSWPGTTTPSSRSPTPG